MECKESVPVICPASSSALYPLCKTRVSDHSPAYHNLHYIRVITDEPLIIRHTVYISVVAHCICSSIRSHTFGKHFHVWRILIEVRLYTRMYYKFTHRILLIYIYYILKLRRTVSSYSGLYRHIHHTSGKHFIQEIVKSLCIIQQT